MHYNRQLYLAPRADIFITIPALVPIAIMDSETKEMLSLFIGWGLILYPLALIPAHIELGLSFVQILLALCAGPLIILVLGGWILMGVKFMSLSHRLMDVIDS